MNGHLKLRRYLPMTLPLASLLGIGLVAALLLPACAVAPEEGDPVASGAGQEIGSAEQELMFQDDITTTTCGDCQVDEWGNKSRVCCVDSTINGRSCYTERKCPDPKEDTLPLSPPTGTVPPIKGGTPLEVDGGLSLTK